MEHHFPLCIREESALSLFNIKENIYKVLSNLKDIIVKLDLKTISISYSDNDRIHLKSGGPRMPISPIILG